MTSAYPCVVIVGHDEYWTLEMRTAVDSYVDKGGHFARFGGNFSWQIRLEDDGRIQVAFKEDAAQCDPVANTGQQHLLTSCGRRAEGKTTKPRDGLPATYWIVSLGE